MSNLSQRIADLSPEKRQLFLQRLKNQKTAVGSPTKIIPQNRNSDSFPLSFAQQRLWFLDQLEPGNTAYNLFYPICLTGCLNVPALQSSLNEVVRRHEALRTTFTTVDGQPFQVIAPTLTLNLPVLDLEKLPADQREAEVLRLAHQEAQQPFDLAKGPLLQVTLLRLTEVEHTLFLRMHHIVSDGWSMGVLIREITVLYEAFSHGNPSPLPELPIQYADFAVWQRQWLQGEALEAQIAYWKQHLGKLPLVELPLDRLRPAVQTYSGARQSMVLPKALVDKLKALHQRQGITLFMTLLAAFQYLLHWYSGQEDIVIGTDIANRNQGETKGLIGFFVNQLVLRTDLSGNPSFRELLERVREITLGAYAHQDLPFDKLVNLLNPERNLNRTPLFQVKIVLENIQTSSLKLSDLQLIPLKVENETVQFDLLLELNETEQGLFGLWEYSTDLFDSGTIVRMVGIFAALLDKIATHPEAKLHEFKEFLHAADKQQQLKRETHYQTTIHKKLTQIKRKSISSPSAPLGDKL
ncbi:condensation domain-containing protein [Cylindrospermum sp. FACHB-282]|uniref:condensation domain-containing protein n=1 Tax=Cylindrospermum sp. FACHB-282 TaxID=2692794 RepID=UPI0016885DE5|nr:condensation domain-containing protein [Cylindrospermum sp. FACHB-282]MBD2385756.1 condensation protein [Cylindrospermum sp. FACHB-282]